MVSRAGLDLNLQPADPPGNLSCWPVWFRSVRCVMFLYDIRRQMDQNEPKFPAEDPVSNGDSGLVSEDGWR
jgi:hypothetical protein